jgi:O-antigen/teichoic acid export membrane protein
VSKRLKDQVIRAVPWSVAESLVNGLAGLALTFILAWFLEPAEVGEATIALAVVGMIEIIAGLGMTEAVVGAKSADTRVSDTAFTTVFSLSIAAAGVCWLLAGTIGRFYGQPAIVDLLRVAALILPLNALVAIPTGLMMRKMRAAPVTLRMTSSRVATILATAVLAYFHFGAWSLVLGTLVGSFTGLVALMPAMSRWPRLRFSGTEFRKLVTFGAALSIERVLWGIMIRLFWLIVGYIHGPTVLGYFQFAQRLVDETANLIQTFVIRFGLSVFAALERAGRDPTDAFMKATLLITAVAAPVFTGLVVVMPDLVGTVFSAKWAPATIVSQIVAFSWAISFPRALVAPVLRARGHQRVLIPYAAAICSVTTVAGLLTAGHGLLVVALAWSLRYLIGIPWSFYAVNRYLGVSPTRQIAASVRPIIAAGLMAGAVLGVGLLLSDFEPIKRLAVEIAVGVATYVSFLALIDRAAVRLGQSFIADMRQIIRPA